MSRYQDDPLYDDAVKTVREAGRVSISLVQNRLGIGYYRAAWLVEGMEVAGLVSPQGADGVRSVLAQGTVEG